MVKAKLPKVSEPSADWIREKALAALSKGKQSKSGKKSSSKGSQNKKEIVDPYTGKHPWQKKFNEKAAKRKSTRQVDDRTGEITGAPARPDLWENKQRKKDWK